MRGGVVAAGAILMIIGGILFFDYPVVNSSNTGANPFGDFFIGPLIGFIGLIILVAGLAASPDPSPTIVYQAPPPASYPASTRGGWSPEPAASVPPASRQPPSSQTPPPAQPSPSAPASAAGPASGGYCPYCGSKISPGYRFCRSCGHSLTEET
jgi:hypothetical protein